MTNSNLLSRSILKISGEESAEFLQNLITNDVNKATAENLIYAFLLSPQGRIQYDMFIAKHEGGYMLDVDSATSEQLFKKLNMYKLRSKVMIERSDISIYASPTHHEHLCFADPRHSDLGFRIYAPQEITNAYNIEEYLKLQMTLAIPDFAQDMTFDRSLPLEMGQAGYAAVDFQKGCYVGQEVTSRMHYRANIRKKPFCGSFEGQPPSKGDEIVVDGIKIGAFMGHTDSLCLMLLNTEEYAKLGKTSFSTGSTTIKVLA